MIIAFRSERDKLARIAEMSSKILFIIHQMNYKKTFILTKLLSTVTKKTLTFANDGTPGKRINGRFIN